MGKTRAGDGAGAGAVRWGREAGERQVPASITALTSSGLGGGVETHYKWSALIMVSAH